MVKYIFIDNVNGPINSGWLIMNCTSSCYSKRSEIEIAIAIKR